MFKKLLVANRAEIACRAMRTAKRMGIATVAVYSDADREALHVSCADESVFIGPAPSAESYLVIDKIVDACRQTGADAVYPGYGFLSENAVFAQRLKTEGIAFVGPGVKAIEAMGDKITSKKIAQQANINTIPGYTDIIKDSEQAVSIANDIGYSVMLKASAGGGGKGMRVAHNETECRDGFERASSEAKSSFGDDRVFMEKFIEQPRHIEIQILADKHGNVIYLNERECSIQRRHQKVIEEAPSPFIDAATRKAMGEQACVLARAVDYFSAGTVEFIVDRNRQFYFLEMNTRLQVEHPVTEMITGLDLVELMLRVANNETLPIKQEDVGINGWSMESRIYAESPFRNFLPSTGRLVRYQEPDIESGVRVDSGVTEGGEVSMFYDPMIAKLVTHADDRQGAIEKMQTALNEYVIQGPDTNIPFAAALMHHERFQRGDITTHFIDEEYPDGFTAPTLTKQKLQQLAIAAVVINHAYLDRAALTTGQLKGHERVVGEEWWVQVGEYEKIMVIEALYNGYIIRFDDASHEVISSWQLGEILFRARIDDAYVCLQIARDQHRYNMTIDGITLNVTVLASSIADLQKYMPIKVAPDMSKFLLSPMPGLLVSLGVQQGQNVKAGEELAVVEAMKMENSLRAERDGVVAKLCATPGDKLVVDQPIIEFEAATAKA